MGQFIVEDDDGVRWEAIQHQMMVGRSPSSHIILHSPTASRRHAWVWRRGDQVIVEDLGSTHGTFVNGQLVTTPRTLVHHDRIKIGDAELRFVAQQSADVEPAQRPPGGPSTADDIWTPPAGVPSTDPKQHYCRHCGASNHPQANFCGRCGQSLAPESARAEHLAGSGGPAWSRHASTPVEPVVARPFPTGSTQARRGGRAGIWVLIALLVMLAVFLLAVLGVLLVYILG